MTRRTYDIVGHIGRNKAGETLALPCFCTANEQVLRAVFAYARERGVPAVIEATCNQVNQNGGYTGMTAADFRAWMDRLSADYGIDDRQIILGGDHLGPNPWRHLPADEALEKAEVLVQSYAAAGFRKIHLDASMACGDEATPSFEEVAKRAARLCKVAEQYSPHRDELVYIIGTEVPVPGGETDDMSDLAVTEVAQLHETIDTHKQAFEDHDLLHVWPKIVSVVTQPGVDFSHTAVHRFEPEKATALSQAIHQYPGLSFEAHSTDYQPTEALQELVNNHFFFLKVGPELTFRMREAIFLLALIENALVAPNDRSQLVESIDHAMRENPTHWSAYYQGDANTVEQLKYFSYSDRIRYYWSVPTVKSSLARLFANLANVPIPETMISQFFATRPFGSTGASAGQLTSDHISLCIDRYYQASGYTR